MAIVQFGSIAVARKATERDLSTITEETLLTIRDQKILRPFDVFFLFTLGSCT